MAADSNKGTAGIVPVDFNLNATDSFKDMFNPSSAATGGNITVGKKEVNSGGASASLLKLSFAAGVAGLVYYAFKKWGK